MKISQHIISFLMGFFLYCLFEIVTRGYTHWTMGVTGGRVISILYGINSQNRISLLKNCFIGAFIITAIEFAVGIFDNIIMHWQVWDYSDMPMNILGQICLPFSCLWFILCIPVYYICKLLQNMFTRRGIK